MQPTKLTVLLCVWSAYPDFLRPLVLQPRAAKQSRAHNNSGDNHARGHRKGRGTGEEPARGGDDDGECLNGVGGLQHRSKNTNLRHQHSSLARIASPPRSFSDAAESSHASCCCSLRSRPVRQSRARNSQSSSSTGRPAPQQWGQRRKGGGQGAKGNAPAPCSEARAPVVRWVVRLRC